MQYRFQEQASSRSCSPVSIFRNITILLIIQFACWIPPAMADLRLTYSLSGPESESLVKHFSVRHFFVRVEDGVDSSSYLLYQAGKFFPLYSVDSSDETWTRLTPPVTASLGPLSRHQKPSAEDGEKKAEASAGAEVTAGDGEKPAVTRTAAEEPALRPTKKNLEVAGIDCRVVHEVFDNEPVVEHCMANSARLGITDRELKTMSRLFNMARQRDFGWLAIGTPDEEFISVQSRDLRNDRLFQLTGVDNGALPGDYLRIPRHYKQLQPEPPQVPGSPQPPPQPASADASVETQPSGE